MQFEKLLSAATATGAGTRAGPLARPGIRSFHARIAGTGAVTATVLIQGSNVPDPAAGDDLDWITLLTITLSGTTSHSDGDFVEPPYRWTRAKVTAISGTGASVDVHVATP